MTKNLRKGLKQIMFKSHPKYFVEFHYIQLFLFNIVAGLSTVLISETSLTSELKCEVFNKKYVHSQGSFAVLDT